MSSLPIEEHYIGFLVYSAVGMNSSVFWEMTPCSPLEVNLRFGETLLGSTGSKNKGEGTPGKLETSTQQQFPRTVSLG
jgi:hypothetical protein